MEFDEILCPVVKDNGDKCGSRLTRRNKFCGDCGTKVDLAWFLQPVKNLDCCQGLSEGSLCGQPLNPAEKFCSNCGSCNPLYVIQSSTISSISQSVSSASQHTVSSHHLDSIPDTSTAFHASPGPAEPAAVETSTTVASAEQPESCFPCLEPPVENESHISEQLQDLFVPGSPRAAVGIVSDINTSRGKISTEVSGTSHKLMSKPEDNTGSESILTGCSVTASISSSHKDPCENENNADRPTVSPGNLSELKVMDVSLITDINLIKIKKPNTSDMSAVIPSGEAQSDELKSDTERSQAVEKHKRELSTEGGLDCHRDLGYSGNFDVDYMDARSEDNTNRMETDQSKRESMELATETAQRQSQLAKTMGGNSLPAKHSRKEVMHNKDCVLHPLPDATTGTISSVSDNRERVAGPELNRTELKGHTTEIAKPATSDALSNVHKISTETQAAQELLNKKPAVAGDGSGSGQSHASRAYNKKEKSTDCDSALMPLLCVHG